MSIRVICPNGHKFKVKNRFAGQTGMCPVCRAKIVVPKPEEDVGEDSIMDILNPEESGLSGIEPETPDFDKEPDGQWSGMPAAPKICCKCFKEMSGDASICPHCKTYVAALD